ncbi:MAG: class I SAM-dependent methyltransferase [Methanomicrobiales archaeon]
MKDWDDIYKDKGMVQVEPSKYVINALNYFKKEKLSKILDLGCGTGRHVAYMNNQGFSVSGCDASTKALEIASKNTPQAKLIYCDFKSLPYPDESFDGVISHGVVHHALMDDIRKAISEIKRVVRSGGLVYIMVPSINHDEFHTGTEIEKNTKINIDSIDGDLPHHYFAKNELEDLFDDFEIIKLEHVSYPSEKHKEKTASGFVVYAKKH